MAAMGHWAAAVLRAARGRGRQGPRRSTAAAGLCGSRGLARMVVRCAHAPASSCGSAIDGISLQEYGARRDALAQRLPANSCAIVPAAPLKIMSNDIPFRFRQDSCLRYLSGFHEPDAVLVIETDSCRKVRGPAGSARLDPPARRVGSCVQPGSALSTP